jgi:hypothetical protein
MQDREVLGSGEGVDFLRLLGYDFMRLLRYEIMRPYTGSANLHLLIPNSRFLGKYLLAFRESPIQNPRQSTYS